jgi:hypothetical protein
MPQTKSPSLDINISVRLQKKSRVCLHNGEIQYKLNAQQHFPLTWVNFLINTRSLRRASTMLHSFNKKGNYLIWIVRNVWFRIKIQPFNLNISFVHP